MKRLEQMDSIEVKSNRTIVMAAILNKQCNRAVGLEKNSFQDHWGGSLRTPVYLLGYIVLTKARVPSEKEPFLSNSHSYVKITGKQYFWKL